MPAGGTVLPSIQSARRPRSSFAIVAPGVLFQLSFNTAEAPRSTCFP
jgi:hypothetical protein